MGAEAERARNGGKAGDGDDAGHETAHWTPTGQTYLGRVTKAHILAAVREAVSDEAAERIAGLKKPEMAQAAEQLLARTGWLPTVLRTEPPAAEPEADTYLQAAE